MTSDGGPGVDETGGLHRASGRVRSRSTATPIVVDLAGELDLYNAHLAREALLEAARRSPERLVVDLSEVTFIDSTGLGVLVETRTRLANRRAFLLVAPGSRRGERSRSPGSTGTSRCTTRSTARSRPSV